MPARDGSTRLALGDAKRTRFPTKRKANVWIATGVHRVHKLNEITGEDREMGASGNPCKIGSRVRNGDRQGRQGGRSGSRISLHAPGRHRKRLRYSIDVGNHDLGHVRLDLEEPALVRGAPGLQIRDDFVHRDARRETAKEKN